MICVSVRARARACVIDVRVYAYVHIGCVKCNLITKALYVID